jgi:hypothetical protein
MGGKRLELPPPLAPAPLEGGGDGVGVRGQATLKLLEHGSMQLGTGFRQPKKNPPAGWVTRCEYWGSVS